MATITDELVELKGRIQTARENETRLKGRRDAEVGKLRELGFKSADAAEKKLKEMRADLEEMDGKIERGIEKLKKDYPGLA